MLDQTKLNNFYGNNWKANIHLFKHSGKNWINQINKLNPSLVIDAGCGENFFKGKIKNFGKSLRDKINDFMKYGWGDKEDYMEIGGRQVDADDPNFIRFIEDNYMGEGESYIEGIENYRRFVEGEGYRRGGIVSLNHMTRAL